LSGLRGKFFVLSALARGETQAAPGGAKRSVPAGETGDSRAVAAALGLSAAGIAPPILVTIFPTVRALIGPPRVADVLMALLILAPAGVGLAVALSGLPQIATSLQRQARHEAEHAVLRVFADTLLFTYALGLAAAVPTDGTPGLALPVVALGLTTAWVVLLSVILRRVPSPIRRRYAMALDIALLSAFLHLAGSAAAGWYPLYLIAVFYAGYRFGDRALIEAAIASLAGFAVVVLSTEFWRQQPDLALGLMATLLVLPACGARLLRATAAARGAAAAAEEDRAKSLTAIADALRPPLAMILGAPAEGPTRFLAERINDVLDLVAVEAGEFSIPIEAFDFRTLVRETLGSLSLAAVEKGIGMRWRIDPRLPPCLRGPRQTIARILGSLAGHFLALSAAGGLRIAIDTVDRAVDQVTMRVRIDASGAARSGEVVDNGLDEQNLEAVAWEHQALTVGVVTRLLALVGGELSIEGGPGPPCRFVVTLTLGIEQHAAEADLDLHGRRVLIVGGDSAFAAELTALLDRWHADARWIGDTEAASPEFARLDPNERPVLIIDGRDTPLAALAFSETAGRLGDGAPFIIFVGESSRIERLAQLDESAFDCLLPVPVTERLVANAFRGLPFDAAWRDTAKKPQPQGGVDPRVPAGEAAGPRDARVTPIAAHPRFAAEMATIVDMQAIEALRALGGEEFLREMIDTFRADARQLLDQLDRAVAATDTAAFARGVAALWRCAGHLGGIRLRELLPSQGVTDAELRQRGAQHLQRVAAEVDRLTAALAELPPASEARRS
jgi:signal transduction histidine kinase/HPt (histidine-containing phosphotransfer) domain-containing protein